MDNETFQRKVARTVPRQLSIEARILHACVGLHEEAEEFRTLPTELELGDIIWFQHALALIFDIVPEEYVPYENTSLPYEEETLLRSLTMAISRITSPLRKKIERGREVDVTMLKEELGVFSTIIALVMKYYGWSSESVLTKNVEKLEERWMLK